jgi:tyrosine-protein phosphatase YwqE
VLVEFSYVAHPVNYRTIFFDLKMAGYEPILAHPERYMYLHQQFDVYRELFETGILLQVNLLSLMGYYGSRVQKVALQLLEEGLVHFVGSDVHHQKHIDTITRFETSRSLEKLLDQGLMNEQL